MLNSLCFGSQKPQIYQRYLQKISLLERITLGGIEKLDGGGEK